MKTYKNKSGFVLTYDYDSLNRIIRISGSTGEKKEYTYDAAGNVTSVTDAYGRTTRYGYSLTGQLIKVIDALGNETEYGYDACDRLIEMRQYGENRPISDEDLARAEIQNRCNRACHVTRYQRNIMGRVEAVTDSLGETERFTYDARGWLAEKLDKEGYLTRYAYTAQGDVSHIRYAPYSAGCSMVKPDGAHPDWEVGVIEGDCSKKLQLLCEGAFNFKDSILVF